jgi:hypothetical protein
MTNVTSPLASAPGERRQSALLHREAIQQFASDLRQKESKKLMISVLQGENPGCMAPANRSTRQFQRFRALLLRIVLLIVPSVIFPAALFGPLFAPVFAPVFAQTSTSGSTGSATGGAMQVPTPQFQTSQVQTSAQNPVFGSVPEPKPTPGVLPLTFGDAIERALRQNLAGLLSEYNTIEARGEKWQQLSDLLPNVSADVQEVAEKESLEALGLRSGGPFGHVPRVIGPFSYFDVRASATQRVFDWKSI